MRPSRDDEARKRAVVDLHVEARKRPILGGHPRREAREAEAGERQEWHTPEHDYA
jgi:hypothetical protein